MVKVKFECIDSLKLSRMWVGKWIEVPMTEDVLCKSTLREWIKDMHGIRVDDMDYTYRVK